MITCEMLMRKLLMCSISDMYFESFLCNIVEMYIFDDLNSFLCNIVEMYIFDDLNSFLCNIVEMYIFDDLNSFLCNIVEMYIFDDLNSFLCNIVEMYIFHDLNSFLCNIVEMYIFDDLNSFLCNIVEMYIFDDLNSFLCNIVEMYIFDDLNSFFKNFIISSYIFVISSALFDSKLLIPTFINIFSGMALILAFSNFSLMSIMFGVKICWHFFSLFKSSGFRNFPLESKNISTLPEISSDFFPLSRRGDILDVAMRC